MPNEKSAVDTLKELLPAKPKPSQSELEAAKTRGQLDAFARVNELTEENRQLRGRIADLESQLARSGELALEAAAGEKKTQKLVAELTSKIEASAKAPVDAWEAGRQFEAKASAVRERSLRSLLNMEKERFAALSREYNDAIAGDLSGDITGLIMDKPTV